QVQSELLVAVPGTTPVGNVSVTVKGSISSPPALVTLGLRVMTAWLLVRSLPLSLSATPSPSTGSCPLSVVATRLSTSWTSVDPPVEATQPNATWYGTPVAGLIHDAG